MQPSVGTGQMAWPKFFPYRYYDHPEGTHLAYKLGVTSVYATFAGSIYLSLDLPLRTQPTTVLAGALRSLEVCGPLVGMAAAFTSVSFLSCRMRERDDPLNYLAGGVAAGHIYGAATRCLMRGFLGSAFLGIAGMTKKYCVDNEYEFFPMYTLRETASLRVRDNDYTLMAERPRDYITNHEKL